MKAMKRLKKRPIRIAFVFMSFMFFMVPRSSYGQALDETMAPGPNFDKAEFRFWLPADPGPVRAIVVPAAAPGTPNTPNAWLISERLAVAWKAVVHKQP
jgi:hypothetical protein